MVLGAATGEPASAIVSEVVSCVPLLTNSSTTFGSILEFARLPAEFTKEALTKVPMKEALEWEIFLLTFMLIAILISN
jgi:hypothetical protein